jgi:hypothetical protein
MHIRNKPSYILPLLGSLDLFYIIDFFTNQQKDLLFVEYLYLRLAYKFQLFIMYLTKTKKARAVQAFIITQNIRFLDS